MKGHPLPRCIDDPCQLQIDSDHLEVCLDRPSQVLLIRKAAFNNPPQSMFWVDEIDYKSSLALLDYHSHGVACWGFHVRGHPR